MYKFIDTKCEICGVELLHVSHNTRFCPACAKIRHRELARARRRRKRGGEDEYTDPLWRAQTEEISPKERYRNRLQRLTDDYRYGARHSVNVADIKRIKAAGKAMGYTAAQINKDIEQAKVEAQSGIKCYHATPEEIKEMLGE